MSISNRASFGVAAALAASLGLTACRDNPYQATVARNTPSDFVITKIAEGSFYSVLDDGLYRFDVPADSFGGKPGTKVPCLMIKDATGERAYGGLDCDWSQLQPVSPEMEAP